MHALLAALAVLAATAGPPAPAAPVVETARFRFHATDGADANARRLAADADARFDRLCAMIDACDAVGGPIDVYLAEDADAFAGVFAEGSAMAEWAVGVAFTGQRRIVLRAHGSALFSLDEIFDHEVSHVLLDEAVGDRHVPRWLAEGIAIWQAGEPVLERLVQAQRAALTDRLLRLSDLDRHFPARGAGVALAYAQAALFVHWVEREHGVTAMPAVVARLRAGDDVDAAFHRALGASLPELEDAWREELARGSHMVSLLADPNLLWGLMSLLFLLVSWHRWRARRAELRAMADQEAAEEDARAWGDEPSAPMLH